MLRNVLFPGAIDAISLDPGEHVFYAGGRDGKIHIAALNAPMSQNSNNGPHVLGSLAEHRLINTLIYSLFLLKSDNM